VTDVVGGGNESFESLLRRFNGMVQWDDILPEERRREHYEETSVRCKRQGTARGRDDIRALGQ